MARDDKERELTAERDQARAELEALKKQLADAQAAPAPAPVVTELQDELKKELTEMRQLRAQLMSELDAAHRAKIAATPAKPKVFYGRLIQLPLPKNVAEPPPGAVWKNFRVDLTHGATRVVRMCVFPGMEMAVRDMVVGAYRKEMNITRFIEHAPDVSEIGELSPDSFDSSTPGEGKVKETLMAYEKDMEGASPNGTVVQVAPQPSAAAPGQAPPQAVSFADDITGENRDARMASLQAELAMA